MHHTKFHAESLFEGRPPSPSFHAKRDYPLLDYRDTTEWEQDGIATTTPSPLGQRLKPEMFSILATSSPEIESLCQRPTFDFFQETNIDPKTSITNMQRQMSSNCVMEDVHMTTAMNDFKESPVMRPVPRVSLSPERRDICCDNASSITPLRPNIRSPLDDITRSLCRVRLATPSSSNNHSHNTRSTPSPTKRPSQLRKLSLHRRVSFDMLPSPSEISACLHMTNNTPLTNTNIPCAASPSKSGRRHRRNTTVIVLSSSRK